MYKFLLFLLPACGHVPLVSVARVDESARLDFEALRGDLNRLSGEETIATGEPGWVIRQNLSVEDYRPSNEAGLFGVCLFDRHEIIVAPADVVIFVSTTATITLLRRSVKMTLAHELGHAMGLQHTHGGIMNPRGVDPACVGFEAPCLLVALQEAGL